MLQRTHNRGKTKALGKGEDADIVAALAQLPAGRLAEIDEGLSFLDNGLGAVFSASMARRAAVQRDKLHASKTGIEAEYPQSAEVTTHTTRTNPVQSLRGVALMRVAVGRVTASIRRAAAQRATIDMLEHVGSTGSHESSGKRGQRPWLRDSRKDDSRSKVRVPPLSDAANAIVEDKNIRTWAAERLRLLPERLNGLESSKDFRAKIGHQELCWRALHTNKLPVVTGGSAHMLQGVTDKRHDATERSLTNRAGHLKPHLYTPRVLQGGCQVSSSSCQGALTKPVALLPMPPERTPAFAAAAEALFGLTRHTDAQKCRRAIPKRLGGSTASRVFPTEDEGKAESRVPGFLDHPADDERDTLSTSLATWSRRLPSVGQARDAAPGIALRRPPAFEQPYAEYPSTLTSGTPEFVYLRRCELAGLVPCPAVWRNFGDGVGAVDVSHRLLDDADIIVIVETAALCASRGHPLLALDLSGNILTDRGLHRIANVLAGPPPLCTSLTSLSLAGNASLRMRSGGIVEDLCAALCALPCLDALDLSGMPLHGQAMVDVAASLKRSKRLRSLHVAGCSLGRADQRDCVAVAGLLGQCSEQFDGLEIADFSGNYFGHAGLSAAAAALRLTRLKRLSLACNAGRAQALQLTGMAGKGPPPRFHPLQLLFEGLLFNITLESLDVTDCGLGPDSAFVLEGALHAHPTITAIHLAENPLGESGVRCILRLLFTTGLDLCMCDIRGNRDADLTTQVVRYRPTQPAGIYRLDLRYPHERATMRNLLRVSASVRGSSANALRSFKFDAKQAHPTIERHKELDRWIVPTQGTFGFSFQPPVSSVALGLSQAVAAAAQRMPEAASQGRRQSVSYSSTPGRSVVQSGSRSKRLSIVPESARSLISGSPVGPSAPEFAAPIEADWTELGVLLRDARIYVAGLQYPVIRDMFLSLVTLEQQVRFIRACSKDMSFNSGQVMRLCEDRPELITQLVSCLLPGVRDRSSQLFLLNNLNASALLSVSREVAPCLWFQEGNLTGSYALDLGIPTDYIIAENCLLANAWESEVAKLQDSPDMSQKGNQEMLRNETYNELPFTYSREWGLPSHGRLSFDYSSIRRPAPSTVAMAEGSEILRHIRREDPNSAVKLRALRAISVHLFLSTNQFRQLLLCFDEASDRQDLFCMLHTRVVDPARLLGADLLHNEQLLETKSVAALLRRVGHLHLLNPLHPEGITFSCNLATYEQRMVIEFLTQLLSKEPGGKVIDVPRTKAEGEPIIVPASWTDKGVPTEDIVVTCWYETPGINNTWRQSLAERYCVGTFATP